MPTYDYVCNACGHRFEEFQSISADPLKKCPQCNKRQLERLIGTGAGVIFKGSGFYETDYRGDSYAADAKKDAESTKSSDSASPSDSAKPSSSEGGRQPSRGSDAAPSGCSTPKADDV